MVICQFPFQREDGSSLSDKSFKMVGHLCIRIVYQFCLDGQELF